jgi:hypothetical protein
MSDAPTTDATMPASPALTTTAPGDLNQASTLGNVEETEQVLNVFADEKNPSHTTEQVGVPVTGTRNPGNTTVTEPFHAMQTSMQKMEQQRILDDKQDQEDRLALQAALEAQDKLKTSAVSQGQATDEGHPTPYPYYGEYEDNVKEAAAFVDSIEQRVTPATMAVIRDITLSFLNENARQLSSEPPVEPSKIFKTVKDEPKLLEDKRRLNFNKALDDYEDQMVRHKAKEEAEAKIQARRISREAEALLSTVPSLQVTVENLRQQYLREMTDTIQTAYMSTKMIKAAKERYTALQTDYILHHTNLTSIFKSTVASLSLTEEQKNELMTHMDMNVSPLATEVPFFQPMDPPLSKYDEPHDSDYSEVDDHQQPGEQDEGQGSSITDSSSSSSSSSSAAKQDRSRSASNSKERSRDSRSRSFSAGTRSHTQTPRDQEQRGTKRSRDESSNTHEDRKRPASDNRNDREPNSHMRDSRPTGKGSGSKGGAKGGKGKGSGGRASYAQRKFDRAETFYRQKDEAPSDRSRYDRTTEKDVVILNTEDIPCPQADKCKDPMNCVYKHPKQLLNDIYRRKAAETERAHTLAMETRVDTAQKLASSSQAMAWVVANRKPHISHGSKMPPGYDASKIEMDDGTFWKSDPNDKYAKADKEEEDTEKLLSKARLANSTKQKEDAKARNLAFTKATSNVGRPEKESKTVAPQKAEKLQAGEAPARDKRPEAGEKDTPARDKHAR